MNFQMFKLDLEKAGTRDQIASICWIIEKAREFQKNIYSCFIDYVKDLTVWITTNCGKFLKEMGIPDHLTCFLRNLYVGILCLVTQSCLTLCTPWTIKQQLELDMEQLTGSKLGNEYDKAVYCHPAYLPSVQNTSCEILGWMSHKLESGLLGEISTISDMQVVPL